MEYNLKFTLKWFNINTAGSTLIVIFINIILVVRIPAIIGTIIAMLTTYLTERGS